MSIREFLTVDISDFYAGMKRAESSADKLARNLNTVLSDANRKQIAEIQALENQIRDTEREKNKLFDPKQIEEANQAIQDLTKEKKKLEDSIKGPGNEVNGLSAKFKQLGGMAKAWIVGVAVASFASLAGVIARSVKEAAEFEEQFNRVTTVIGESGANTAGMEKDLRHLAANGRTSLKDLSNGLYETISAGVGAADSIKFLDAANRAAIAGNTDVKTSVDGLTSVMNAYGLQASDARKISDSMFIAVRNGKMTFEELSNSIGRVAPLANAANMTMDEMLSIMSAITSTGLKAPEASTGLRGILAAIMKPTEQAREAAKQMGVQFDATALKSQGFIGFMTQLKNRSVETGISLSRLFPEIEGFNSILALTGPQAGTLAKNLEDMGTAAGETDRQFNTMNTSLTAVWETTKNRVSDIFIQLGEKVLPVLNDALGAMLDTMKGTGDEGRDLARIMRELGVDDKTILRVEAQQALLDARRLKQDLENELSGMVIGIDFELKKEHEYTNVGGNPVRTGRSVDVLRAQEEINIGQYLEDFGAEATISRLEMQLRKLAVTSADVAKQYQFGTIPIERFNDFNRVIGHNSDSLRRSIETLKTYSASAEIAGLSLDKYLEQQASIAANAESEAARAARAAQEAADALEVQRLANVAAQAEKLKGEQEAFRLVMAQVKARQEIERIVRSGLQDVPEWMKTTPEGAKRIREELAELRDQFDMGVISAEAFETRSDQLTRRLNNPPDGLKWMNDELATFNEQMTDLRLSMERGEITQEVFDEKSTQLAEGFRQVLEQVYSTLEEMGVITPQVKSAMLNGLTAISKEVKETDKNIHSMSDSMMDVTEAASSVFNLADAFGEMDENIRKVARGSIDAIRNLSRLQKLQEMQKAGEKVSGIAMAVPMLGIAAGLATVFSAVLSQDSEAAQMAKEQADRMKELTTALEENRYAYQKAASDFLKSSVVGSDLRSSQLDRIRELFDTLNESLFTPEDNGRRPFGPGTGGSGIGTNLRLDQVEAILRELERSGVPQFQGLIEQLNLILEQNGNDLGGALRAIIDELGGSIEDIINNFGTFGDSLNGVMKKFELSKIIGISDQDAFDNLIADLLNLGEATGEARSLLEQLAGIDVTTEEGRDQVKMIAQALGQAFLDNQDLFGDFTPEELEQLINRLLGISSETGAGSRSDEGFSRSQQVARTITDVQASEVIALLSNIEMWNRLSYLYATTGAIAKPADQIPGSMEMLSSAIVDAIEGGNMNVTQLLARLNDSIEIQIELHTDRYDRLIQANTNGFADVNEVLGRIEAGILKITNDRLSLTPTTQPGGPNVRENEVNIGDISINGKLTDRDIDEITFQIGKAIKRQQRRTF